jgi:hypothetical protein
MLVDSIHMKKRMNRNRIGQTVLMVITIIIGLSSRKFPQFFTVFLAEYLGDTLWAMLVFWLLGFIFTRKPSLKLAIAALIFSYGIEISQLYHAPWIDSIRDTTLGALVLGHGFLWSDMLCYSVGILVAYLFEIFSTELKH